MSFWVRWGNDRDGGFKLPNGMNYQYGTSSATNASNPIAVINFPIQFPKNVILVNEHDTGAVMGIKNFPAESLCSMEPVKYHRPQ
ncbi:gp53-like domain-containing protein [Hafnia alvei]|uniref:gp53-like domain-containing protein n=1 Tax=Hafnia alvei TaxID=569 RepID=UPI003B58B13F